MKVDLDESSMLTNYMRIHKISRNDLCQRLHISRAMLSYYLNRVHLSNRFKAKLWAVGIEVFPLKNLPETNDPNNNAALLEQFKMLESIISHQKEFISHVTLKCRHGVCLNFVLK